jgi:hypothetical protein
MLQGHNSQKVLAFLQLFVPTVEIGVHTFNLHELVKVKTPSCIL